MTTQQAWHAPMLFLACLLAAAAGGGEDGGARPEDPAELSRRRAIMLSEHIEGRGIRDADVLEAMRKVPRHEFVPPSLRKYAYQDGPLPIGHGQTISQPYIVALMTELSGVRPGDRVLDVGTGSGYQAAVLAEIAEVVYSIEIVGELAAEAAARLERLGYDNVHVREGDGWLGWPEHAPFDAIVLAAAPDEVPRPLVDQLRPGGRLVLPVGDRWQELVVVEKDEQGSIRRRSVTGVRFVPMTGIAQDEPAGDSRRSDRPGSSHEPHPSDREE